LLPGPAQPILTLSLDICYLRSSSAIVQSSVWVETLIIVLVGAALGAGLRIGMAAGFVPASDS
jgi:hypothetical protein